jgi:hypothetical protein
MTVLRKYNTETSEWEIIFTGETGPTGPTGPSGLVSGNIDGGNATSNYGGTQQVDGGSA